MRVSYFGDRGISIAAGFDDLFHFRPVYSHEHIVLMAIRTFRDVK
jgi:hypothetical protein